jgi:hypothetical protein
MNGMEGRGKTPNPTRPPWTARNERERRAMVDWVNKKLDEENATEAQRYADNFPPVIAPEHAEKYFKWRSEGGLERAAAEAGVIDLARALVRSRWPYLADLVQLPPLKRGEKFRPELTGVLTGAQLRHKLSIADAAKDVKRIRRLWQAHYGQKNRRPSDGPSAVQIAAKRHGVSVEEVELRLKKFLRVKSPIS